MFTRPFLYPVFDITYLKKRNLDKDIILSGWLKNGIQLIQLRCKDCSIEELKYYYFWLKNNSGNCAIIINDYWEFAIENQTGFHIGKEDYEGLSNQEKSVIKNAQVIKGTSSHSFEDLEALENFWDYSGIGPVFPTSTKISANQVLGINKMKLLTFNKIPLVGIGGISPDNLADLLEAKPVAIAGISCFMEIDQFHQMQEIFRSFFID